ncbi:MAG: hypothetical protein KDA81_10640 [Planctomycetaceae bacterium]|nr:hypothetical protein [Planctomycetaceae bacterium]
MALIEINLTPSDRQLRQFGCICAVALPGLVWFWTRDAAATQTAVLFGITIAVAGWVLPKLIRPLFVLLVLLTLPIGLIVGEILLLGVFLGVFLPMALLFRLMGRDALRRRKDNRTSHWHDRPKPSGPGSYLRQW